MNTTEILSVLNSDQAVKQILLGVFPLDFLPVINTYPAALVINLDPSHMPGLHWVALSFNKSGTCNYFDSYGLKPSDSIKQFKLKNAKKYVYNNKQVQRFFSSTCGHMCIYFLIWQCRGIPFANIVNSMSSDEFITGFVNALFKLNSPVYNYNFIVNQTSINMEKM